jgi:hypothetical protein
MISFIKNFFRRSRRTAKSKPLTEEELQRKSMGEFKAVGERFRFLGVDMLVMQDSTVDNYRSIISVYPCLVCRYVDKRGELRDAKFYFRDLPALIAESKRSQL